MSEEQMAGINRKIESMGEAIVGKIEKKLAGSALSAAPGQAEVSAAMLSKIEEMDAAFKDFQKRLLLEAAQRKAAEQMKAAEQKNAFEHKKVVEQVKTAEHPKTSALSEIEDLLKVLKEQQKYTELDRQIHNQLEKAWGRVEDMEKRLLDFYSTVSNRAPQAAAPAEPAPQVGKMVEAGIRELSTSVDARFDVLTSEMRHLNLETAKGKDQAAVRLEEVKRELLSSVAAAFSEGFGALAKQLDAGIKGESERTLAAFAAMRAELEKTLKAGLEAAAADVRAENAKQLEKIRALYGLSAANRAAMSAVTKNIGDIEKNLCGVQESVQAFVKGFESVNMNLLVGVSGDLIRQNFKAASALAAELEKDARAFAKLRGEITANIAGANVKVDEAEK